MSLFIDTWAWLTVIDRSEHRHTEVVHLWNQARQDGVHLVTTDYVLDEVFTLLFRRLPHSVATRAIHFVQDSARKGFVRLEPVFPIHFERALELRHRYKDKPKISFTDLTTMAVMTHRGITRILTEDDHFLHVGLGFIKVP